MTDDTPSSRRSTPDGGSEPRDVNEAVAEEWVEETTPFERVYEIVHRTYEPESADRIADRARVSATTARKHLRTLVDSGEVATTEDGATTRYRRSETAIVTEHAQSLLSELTPEEIASGIADMKASIREWREEYGVESPEEFARELDVADADDERGAVLTEWQTTRRNLALAQAAVAISDAHQSGHLTGTDTDDDGNGDTSVVV
ncbi:helix-turn-helix domain-containing protein [Halorussus salilacus]|uniref:helix-turn-helix domain-containing protein n=1 Tax=Halorussus salilacus TaxID=2953750 RepID=UPI00209CF181|nr:helix-turn-helix domain-containing protein [Halorussus salilacus]USZ67859.1 helix-turn-helix domain-containing protein [Halorussus salilacus]